MFFRSLLSVLFFAGVANQSFGAQPSEFDQVAAIFSSHCVRCHNESNNKGDFSLSNRKAFFESGAVEPGDNASHLLNLIEGPDQSMPKQSPPLAKEDVQTIRQWIIDGAKWPEDAIIAEKSKADKNWWSLQPLAKIKQGSIDSFIDAKLRNAGLKRNPIADRRTLIRRATFDLTGLPPTPAEVAEFVKNDQPNAYEQLIDRLLSSPAYGQRWGRHWLDVVRFGESNGFERNVIINDLWPFRDYIIDSFNDDKPFNQLVREHLAGDALSPGDPKVEIGAAFLVAGPYDNVGNQDAEQKAQIRANTIDEMIRSTSQAFLGMTIGCARCHNHKFDPIEQADYYKLYATFAGTHHGSRVVATKAQQDARNKKLAPLNKQKAELTAKRKEIDKAINKRIKANTQKHAAKWTRQKVDRTGTTEIFDAVKTKFVRLICEGLDTNPAASSGFRIDEFQIWSDGDDSQNVALASAGAKATGPSRAIEDFRGAYGPHLAIDGQTGARFMSTSNHLTIELAKPTVVNKVVFSSARGERIPEHRKFIFVSDYRIEVSSDGKTWKEVAHGRDRKPANDRVRDHRLRKLETTDADRKAFAETDKLIRQVDKQIRAVPKLPSMWVGKHNNDDTKRPFQIFVGGSPQRKGDEVTLTSLSMLDESTPRYELPNEVSEKQRRKSLAQWIIDPQNPLTPRVITNRLWHYHFGTGIVNTPSDFGYMGGQPSHSELLDWLAQDLIDHGWRLKPIHKIIMMSETYRQSSDYNATAAKIDFDSRLLWRFPPRRLSAEEIRDTMLAVAGKLDPKMGGPGFRLYRYLQDNVATYVPLDQHGPETYRRAVYHQNARAARTDLMTDFDQPDCAFSTARRAQTTTPLQALATLNHQFSLDMAGFMAERLKAESDDVNKQVDLAYQLAYARKPNETERADCLVLVQSHSLKSFCRVLLNTSELIHVR